MDAFENAVVKILDTLIPIKDNRAKLLLHLVSIMTLDFRGWLHDIDELALANKKYTEDVSQADKNYLASNKDIVKMLDRVHNSFRKQEKIAIEQKKILIETHKLLCDEMKSRTPYLVEFEMKIKVANDIQNKNALTKIVNDMKNIISYEHYNLHDIPTNIKFCKTVKEGMETQIKLANAHVFYN